MKTDPSSLSPRQQSLAFATDQMPPKLPGEVLRLCHDRLTQLLEAAIQAERRERSNAHERQDPT